ncbi:MAG: hypothetical protein WB392_03780 [Methanotrichaceae archaeon]
MKKALGKGLNALIPDKSDNLDVNSPNLEVRSNNLELITTKSEVIGSNIEDKSTEVKSSNSEVITIISEGISYNLEVLSRSVSEAEKNPRISLWSPLSTAVLRYLRNTKPAFSISEEASELLEDAIIRKYPELAERIKAEMKT